MPTDRQTTRRTKLRTAGFFLHIGDITISFPDDPDCIAISRNGEGGHFSLQEFQDVIREFVSARL